MTICLLSHVLLITSALFNFLLPTTCIDRPYSQAMLMDGKTRLGSSPPSCHNRCNGCNPCTAVQVPPPLPGRRVGGEPVMAHPGREVQPGETKDYSNYKPIGWKCRCGDHLYKPIDGDPEKR